MPHLLNQEYSETALYSCTISARPGLTDSVLMALGDSGHMVAVMPENASELEQLKEQVEKLTEMVAAIPVCQKRAKRRCYHCRHTGHLQRDCPFRDHCFTCGQPGQIGKNCRQGNDQGASVKGSRRPWQK